MPNVAAAIAPLGVRGRAGRQQRHIVVAIIRKVRITAERCGNVEVSYKAENCSNAPINASAPAASKKHSHVFGLARRDERRKRRRHAAADGGGRRRLRGLAGN